MNRNLRRLVGVLSVGGGAVGATIVGQQFFVIPPNFLVYVGLATYFSIACWGVIAGILLLESDPLARRHAVGYWACQVPVLFLPGIGHKLGLGAHLFLWAEYPLRFNAFLGIGAQFQFSIFQDAQPIAVGVNAVALCILVTLLNLVPDLSPKGESHVT